jgi:hypothetical protein
VLSSIYNNHLGGEGRDAATYRRKLRSRHRSRYRVELSQAERGELTTLLSGGKHAARKLKRAQSLPAADAGASDEEIARSIVSIFLPELVRSRRPPRRKSLTCEGMCSLYVPILLPEGFVS